jgi:drug/metabolite transporter (DMT)-like permease
MSCETEDPLRYDQVLMAESSQGQSHLLPVGEALVTALIWSSSFVGVKFALRSVGPFSLAGIRYFLAFLFLLPWVIVGWRRAAALSRAQWIDLALIGIFQYTIGNGALFLALRVLPATTGSLALCLVPIPVLLLGLVALKERPRAVQIVGLCVAVGASVLFFLPGLRGVRSSAVALLGVSILSFAAFPILVRKLARTGKLDTVRLTALPLGIGGIALLLIAAPLEGVPHAPPAVWGVILGLATVNTVLAYLLYNHSLRRLTAVEADVLLNLTPLGTALIAWGALDERLTGLQIAAMLLVVAGTTLAQWRSPKWVLRRR